MTTSPSLPAPRPDEDDDEEVLPALYHHCVKVYAAMFQQARPVTPMQTGAHDSDPDLDEPDDADAILVYEGHLTRLITQDLHLSVPYYTSVTAELKRMNCIAQLRRGGGTAPSQWQLLREPDEDLYRNALRLKKAPQGQLAQLEQQLRAVTQRVSLLEDALTALLAKEA
jgi:hypothetical protein